MTEIPSKDAFRKAAAEWNPLGAICDLVADDLAAELAEWVADSAHRGVPGIPENHEHDIMEAAGWWGCDPSDILGMLERGELKASRWDAEPVVTEDRLEFRPDELFAVQMHALTEFYLEDGELPLHGMYLVPGEDDAAHVACELRDHLGRIETTA